MSYAIMMETDEGSVAGFKYTVRDWKEAVSVIRSLMKDIFVGAENSYNIDDVLLAEIPDASAILVVEKKDLDYEFPIYTFTVIKAPVEAYNGVYGKGMWNDIDSDMVDQSKPLNS